MSQEPLFWYRPRSDGGYEGPLHNGQIGDVRKASGAWVPLFAGAAPVSAEPTDDEIIDIAVEPLGIDCDRMPYGVVVFARALLSRYSSAPVAAQPDVTQQTLNDVMAGIPARDAEIEALRKEIETLRAAQAQQPVSGADGLSFPLTEIERKAISALIAVAGKAYYVAEDSEDDGSDSNRVDKESMLALNEALDALESLPDDQPGFVMGPSSKADWALRRLIAGDANIASKALNAQPSGNAGEFESFAGQKLMEAYKAGMHGKDYCMPRARELLSRAALAQQDATLQAEVLNMVRMLEVNEWADHCGQSELGKRLEWAITALQNRPQNIPEIIPESAQQDADKVDAEPDMFWNADNPEQCQDSIHNLLVEVQCDRTLRVGDIVEIQQAMTLPNISVRVTAVDGEDDDGDLEYEIVNDAAIDAARKEPGQ